MDAKSPVTARTAPTIHPALAAGRIQIAHLRLPAKDKSHLWKMGARRLSDAVRLAFTGKIDGDLREHVLTIAGDKLGTDLRGTSVDIFQFVAEVTAHIAAEYEAKLKSANDRLDNTSAALVALQADHSTALQAVTTLEDEVMRLHAEHKRELTNARTGHAVATAVIKELKMRLIRGTTVDLTCECPEVGPGELKDLVIDKTGQTDQGPYEFKAFLENYVRGVTSPFENLAFLELPPGLVEAFARLLTKSPGAILHAGGPHAVTIRTTDGKTANIEANNIRLGFAPGKNDSRQCLKVELTYHTVTANDVEAAISETAAGVAAEIETAATGYAAAAAVSAAA